MKKFIGVFMVAIMCIGLFGCSSEPEKPIEVDVSQFPDAQEFDNFEWPTFGMATKLPTPKWSNRGRILNDTETYVWIKVGYSTLEDYNDYIKSCQKVGFTENYFNLTNRIYYAENSDGYAIELIYSQSEQYVDVRIATDTSDWDKWWEEEE